MCIYKNINSPISFKLENKPFCYLSMFSLLQMDCTIAIMFTNACILSTFKIPVRIATAKNEKRRKRKRKIEMKKKKERAKETRGSIEKNI